VLQVSYVQTFLGQIAANKISEITRTPISVEGVSIRGLHSFTLKGLYIEDYKKDTLMYTKRLKVNIDSFNIDSGRYYIGKVELDDMFFNLQEDRKAVLNVEHFIDSLSKGPSDTTQQALDIRFKDISIRNSRFVYEVEGYGEVDYEINWDHILVDDLNVDIENLYFDKGTAYFYGKSVSLRERTGFFLEKLSGQASLGPGLLNVKNLFIRTPLTNVNLSRLTYKWIPGRNDWSEFLTKMDQMYVIEESTVSFSDLAHFNGKLKGLKEIVHGKAVVYSTINNLKGKDLDITIGKNTHIRGEFETSGLPEIFDARYKLKLDKFDFDFNDIEQIYIPWEDDNQYTFWSKLKNLGVISYLGVFDGTFSDFVCTGILNTDAGSIVANTKIVPSKLNSDLNLDGYIKFLDFDLGLFLDNSKIGKVKLDTKIKGVFDNKFGFKGNVDGNIGRLNIFDYSYKNLTFSGDFDKKKFFGELKLEDNNVSMDFMGGLDFNDSFPVANFKSTIRNARLKNLNLIDNDIAVSLDIKADFTGNSLDNFDGSINVSNTLCSNLNDTLRIDNFSLYTGVEDDINNLTLKSDFASFSIKGDYRFSTIVNDFKDVIYTDLPNYKPRNYYVKKKGRNKFLLSLKVHENMGVLKLFYPALRLSSNTNFLWDHYYSDNYIKLNMRSPQLSYMDNDFNDFVLKISTENDNIKCETSVGSLNYGNSYTIYNLKNKINASENSIKTSLSWNNWGEKTYGGYFSAAAKISKERSKPRTDISFDEGALIIADSLWSFKPASLSIRGDEYTINDFKFYKDTHYIGVNGKISKSPKDTVSFIFNKCDVDKFIEALNLPITNLKGTLDGSVKISDFYNKTKAISDISIKNIIHNDEKLGDINLSSQWDDKSRRLLIDANSILNNKKQLSIEGWYQPSNDKIDIVTKLDSLSLSYAKVYFPELFSDFNGYAQADLEITNTLKKPRYRGYFYFDNADFTLKANNTKYFCNDIINIANKNLSFDNFIIKDAEGSKANILGKIQISNKMKFDLAVSMNKFKVLNTNSSDNTSFYGKAYLTGRAKILGATEDLNVDINVKTENGTDLSFPLSKGSSVSSSDFISFIDSDNLKSINASEETSSDDEYVSESNTSINLNCNLEVTEDVNTQIIFNEKLGDAIKANGKGNLKIQMSKAGDLDIYGTYNIVKGSYLFTLQNMVVSKFILAEGGSIKWSGSPFSAMVDLNAIYKLRTTLYNLMPDNKNPNISLYNKIPVNCIINLTDNLMNPNIKFNIDFPSLNSQNRSYVKSLFRSQDDINKQFVYLLILNRFNTPEYVVMEDGTKSNASVGLATASELLSNQLSSWLSQISDDFDFGFKYRPKDDISSDEIELALSTQLFSDRVTLNVNGNINTGNNEKAVTNNNTIIGDFDIVWKLSRDGNFKVKAYSKTNNQVSYTSSKTTQGVGVQYQEEFNSFSELISKYFKGIFGKKEEKDKKDKKKKKK
jgi:hypothetical protein